MLNAIVIEPNRASEDAGEENLLRFYQRGRATILPFLGVPGAYLMVKLQS
jgi:hypothetical protein